MALKRKNIEGLGEDYDANCGQEIACDILPKYIDSQELLSLCYQELCNTIVDFAEHIEVAQLAHSQKENDAQIPAI